VKKLKKLNYQTISKLFNDSMSLLLPNTLFSIHTKHEAPFNIQYNIDSKRVKFILFLAVEVRLYS